METFSSLLRDINYVLETSGSGATPLLIAGGIVFGTGMFVTLCFLALKPLQPLFRGPQRKAAPGQQHTKGVREKTLKERSSAPASAAGGGIADRPSDASAASSVDATDATPIETAERTPEIPPTLADGARLRPLLGRGSGPVDAVLSDATDDRRAPMPLPLRSLPKRAILAPALADRVEPQIAAPRAAIVVPPPPVAASAGAPQKTPDALPAPAAKIVQPVQADVAAPESDVPVIKAPELRSPLAARPPLPRLNPRPLPSRVRPLQFAPPQGATEPSVARAPMPIIAESRPEPQTPAAEPIAPVSVPSPKPTSSARTITLPKSNAQLVRLTALRARTLA